ncbi:unnamed protein product [Coccothraustes coccothraustes]
MTHQKRLTRSLHCRSSQETDTFPRGAALPCSLQLPLVVPCPEPGIPSWWARATSHRALWTTVHLNLTSVSPHMLNDLLTSL